MDDDTRAALDHPGHEGSVKADSGQQVEVDLIKPNLIGECSESATGSVRAAEIVNENIHASQIPGDGFGNSGRPSRGAKIARHEMRRKVMIQWRRACGRHEPSSS